MIRRKIITQEDVGLVNMDRGSFGIGFYLGDDSGFPKKLLTQEEIDDDRLYFEGDDRYSLKLYEQPDGKYLVDWYENLNGNEIACEYLAQKYPDLDFRNQRSVEGKQNLVSISMRNQIQDLDQVFTVHVPRLIYEKLAATRLEIHALLVARFGEALVRSQSYFRIQSFEANLDVPSPVGDDYGRNSLIATLLSQHALQSASGYYLNDSGYVVAQPKNRILDPRMPVFSVGFARGADGFLCDPCLGLQA